MPSILETCFLFETTLENRKALSLKWIFSQNQSNYHFLHGSQIEAFWYANMVHIAEKSLSRNWLFFVTNVKGLFVDLNCDLLTTKLFQICNKHQDLCYNINEMRIVCVCRPKYKMVMPFVKSFFDSNSNYITYNHFLPDILRRLKYISGA